MENFISQKVRVAKTLAYLCDMKNNKLQNLSDQEIAKRRKEYFLWGMIPATVFILLEIYITYNPEYRGMEMYVLLGLVATFPFIFQAGKYSKEQRRRQNL